MVMRKAFFLLFVGSFCCTFGSNTGVAADEQDFYRMISVATSKAPTESRSKNWKRGAIS